MPLVIEIINSAQVQPRKEPLVPLIPLVCAPEPFTALSKFGTNSLRAGMLKNYSAFIDTQTTQ